MFNITEEEIRDKMFFIRQDDNPQPIAVIKVSDLMATNEKIPQGDLISRIYVCPFCAHKIQVTEQFLPKVTECEVFGAEIKGDSDMRKGGAEQ